MKKNREIDLIFYFLYFINIIILLKSASLNESWSFEVVGGELKWNDGDWMVWKVG